MSIPIEAAETRRTARRSRTARWVAVALSLPLWAGLLACAPTVTETEAPSGSADPAAAAAITAAPVERPDDAVAPAVSVDDFQPIGSDRPLRVVATVGQIADLVRAIGGVEVELTQIVPGADDPHLYVPSPSDVSAFSEADLIVYNGLFLEGQMGETFAQMGQLGIPSVPVTAGLEPERLLTREYSPGVRVHDPHVWFDPQLWAQAADTLLTALSGRAPERAAGFAERHGRLREDLAALERWAEASLAQVPESQRVLVTSHDAFGYFGRRFGLEVVGLQGLSTEAEAGLQDVERLVDLIVEREIPAVFVEASVNPEALEAVVEAVRRRGHDLAIGGELYSDTPGVEGSAAGTYPGMLVWNVATVSRALGGRAVPELPERLTDYGGHDLAALLDPATGDRP